MAVMEGSLSKWTNVMKGWQYRWFVLDDNSGLLSYYTSKEKMMRGVRRGCVRLKGAVIGIDDEDDSTFTVTVDHKTFHFQARDAEERQKWVHALEETIIRHGSRTRWDSHHPSPTIKDFDNKVSEADAYLQLMIEQTKKLEERITTMTDQDEKAKCQLILEHANVMLDNIKHSIVLLQIAKNTAHPVNGIYHQRPGPSNNVSSQEIVSAPGEAVVQQGIELGSECLENARRLSRTIGESILHSTECCVHVSD
uniref:Oxysterol-binding protein-related protein n=1 Tax=Anoplophora glabripennis TaxID=217634 RepID=V5GZE6_ANOGL